MMDIDGIKILILFSLLIMTFVFGIIPVIFIRYIEKASESQQRNLEEEQRRKKTFSRYWRILSFLNCFAAGVFLATCLLELLPSVRHNFMKLLFTTNVYTGFPLAEFTMTCGLFFILIIEQIALSVKESSVPGLPSKRKNSENDIRQPLLANNVHDSEVEPDEEKMASIHNDHFLGGLCDEADIPVTVEENACRTSTNSPHQITSLPGRHGTNTSSRDTPGNSLALPNPSPSQSIISREQSQQKTSGGEHNIHVHSVFRSMFLLFALSLHAIFEGLTVGLQTDTSTVLSIFAALVVHKSILSFSLGMNLMQSKISVKSAIKSVILFSVAAPIGLVIGMGIIDLWDTTKSGAVHGILQGFASGTFLYIIFFEILPKEFNSKMDRLLKVLFLIIGYAVITGILFLGDGVKHPFCLINKKGEHP